MRIAALGRGALLCAALPLFAQTTSITELLKFSLNENPAQIGALLGNPVAVDEESPSYRSWQYQIDNADTHNFSHVLCIRKSDGQLISVTRNNDEPCHIDELFPPAESATYHWPPAGPAQFHVRTRRLSGDRVLVAMGVSAPGEPTTQLLLIRRSAMPLFLPWLADEMK